jgi:hypothetical protein
MRIRHLTLLLLLVVLALPLGAAPASASCVMAEGSLKARLRDDDIVFVGTVTSTEAGNRLAEVDVEEVWRGNVEDHATVAGGETSPNTISSVDREYREGTRYLFTPYAQRKGVYQDSICSDTQRWSTKLGKARPEGATSYMESRTTPIVRASESAPEAGAPAEAATDVVPRRSPLTYVLFVGLILVAGAVVYALGRKAS